MRECGTASVRHADARNIPGLRLLAPKNRNTFSQLAEAIPVGSLPARICSTVFGDAGPLLDEHFIAIEAIDAMKKSLLGRILELTEGNGFSGSFASKEYLTSHPP